MTRHQLDQLARKACRQSRSRDQRLLDIKAKRAVKGGWAL